MRTAQVAFGGGGARIELFEFRSPRGGSVALRTADVGFAHVCVTCDDLDALLERLVAAGGRPVSEPVAVDSGANAGGRGVYVRDPDGHVLELFTRLRRPDDALRPTGHRLDAVRRAARAAAADPAAPHRDPDGRLPHRSAPRPTRSIPSPLELDRRPRASSTSTGCTTPSGSASTASRPSSSRCVLPDGTPGGLLAVPRARVRRRRRRRARGLRPAEEARARSRSRRTATCWSAASRATASRSRRRRCAGSRRPRRATSSSGSCPASA